MMAEKPLVVINAEDDPTYAPYCLRCRTMRRMRKVEPLYWKCSAGCGAVADYREWLAACPTTPTRGSDE